MYKMPIICHKLRSILSDTSACCCLCFRTIGETETPFNIEDEVSLGVDNEQTEVLYEIINTVLGNKVSRYRYKIYQITSSQIFAINFVMLQVLDSISALKVICQKCTGIVLNCYKFIQQCQQNIEQLCTTIDSMLKHKQMFAAGNYDYKSIFVALDTSNTNVGLFYDKHQNCNEQTLLRKRFQRLYKDAQQIYINIELEPNCSADNEYCAEERRKQSSTLQSFIFADIAHGTDDLNNLKCKTCSKTYLTATKMKQHYLRVHAPKNFKCSQCPKSFGTSILLKYHTKGSHSNAVCSQCGRTFTNLYTLRHHEYGHKGLGFACQTCGKVYKGKQAYKNHIENKLCGKMRKSNSESQFTCDYCGKKYAQKSSLSNHTRLEHENGRALICDWCGKKCSSASRLKDHIVTHTKQKNFECEQCGGKFVSKTSLLYHTRIHTGEKPYKCDHCDMTFISASRHSEHVKQLHTQTNFECNICHGKFKGNITLVRHRRKHFDVRSRFYCKPMPSAVLSSNNGNPI